MIRSYFLKKYFLTHPILTSINFQKNFSIAYKYTIFFYLILMKGFNLVASQKGSCNTLLMKVVHAFQKDYNKEKYLSKVHFNRTELQSILQIYGRMVSLGECRDYSISSSLSQAIFCIFKRSSEQPLYMVIKTPKLSKKNRLFSIVAMDGQIINHGEALKSVLSIFQKRLLKCV